MKDIDGLDFLPGDEATEKPPSIFNNVANQPGYRQRFDGKVYGK